RRASASTTPKFARRPRPGEQPLTFPDVLQVRPEACTEIGVAQTVLDGGAQISDLAAAVVANAGERQHVHGLVVHEAGNAVGQLDLTACAALSLLELGEDAGRQDVAADDREIRRRILRLRLLNDACDALRATRLLLHGNDSVAASLIRRHRLHAE